MAMAFALPVAPVYGEKKISKIVLDASALDALTASYGISIGVMTYEFTYSPDGHMATSSLSTVADGLRYIYNLTWESDRLVCTRTAGTDAATETYYLNAAGLATSFKDSNGSNATFTYDSSGYLTSASGTRSNTPWSAEAVYQNLSMSKATITGEGQSFVINLTSSTRQDPIGLYMHLYDSVGFATGFFSGIMGHSSKMLPQKASATIQSIPITLNWTYTYTSDGLVSSYTESSLLLGTLIKAQISYCDVTAVQTLEGDSVTFTIEGNNIYCPGYEMQAYTPSGAHVASGKGELSLPCGIYIIKGDTFTKKIVIK